jgi:enoyl-CoA hydratase
MPAEPTVLIDHDRPVSTVTLSRPDALNALTPDLLVALREALDALAADPEVRVVVLTGAGRAFSAGVDLKALGDRRLEHGAVGAVIDGPGRAAIAAITTMPQVVVARVNGFCFTGALELVLACDLVVAAEEARFGDTHAKWGLRPTWGMSQRLVAAVGVTRARHLAYTARTFTGTEAAAWGLATLAVPLDDLDAAVAGIAAEIVATSAGSNAAYKDLFGRAPDLGLADGLAYEAATTYPISDTEDRIAAFR